MSDYAYNGDEIGESRVERECEKLRRLLHYVLHQRTGPSGQKIEDILQRENEPLLLEILSQTRFL